MRVMVCLVLMLALEPGNHCLRACTDKLFYPHCNGSQRHEGCTLVYLAIAMLLYWLLLTKSGAFLAVLLYLIVTFASASSSLNQELKNFAGMHAYGRFIALGDSIVQIPNLAFRISSDGTFVMITTAILSSWWQSSCCTCLSLSSLELAGRLRGHGGLCFCNRAPTIVTNSGTVF